MILNRYNQILDKYKLNEYKIRVKKDSPEPIISEKEYPLHAINYILFEYLKQKGDNRWKTIIDYILIPNNIKINISDINFEDIMKLMIEIKS